MRFAPQLKLSLHDEFIKFIKGGEVHPINVEISATGSCNASCPWCFYKNMRDNEFLLPEILHNLLIDLKGLGVKAVSWTGGGEPTLYPYFNEAIKLADGLGLRQGLFTNCLKEPDYDSSLLDWIRVSKTNLPFNKVNISKLESEAVGLCINYVGNDGDVLNALSIVDEFNLNYLQVRPALNPNGELTLSNPTYIINNWVNPKLDVTEYKFSEAGKPRDYVDCYGYHFVPFVWQNGDVSVCAYHKGDSRFNLGNLYNDSISDIINSMPDKVSVIPSCQICCKNHEINKLINYAKRVKDVDFV